MILAVVCANAAPIPIPGLVSTGLGTLGSTDPNWTLIGGTAYITDNSGFPFPTWSSDTSTSRWISPRSSYIPLLSDPAGNFTFQLIFNLTGYDVSTAQFSYRMAADNAIVSVRLNSTNLSGSAPSDFTLGSTFNYTSAVNALVAGTNTLQVTVRNDPGTSGNPAGLRFEILSSSILAPVPEPSTVGLCALGLTFLIARRRRVS
jgi:hypothetical protein